MWPVNVAFDLRACPIHLQRMRIRMDVQTYHEMRGGQLFCNYRDIMLYTKAGRWLWQVLDFSLYARNGQQRRLDTPNRAEFISTKALNV